MPDRDKVSAKPAADADMRAVTMVGTTIDSGELFARSREVLIVHGADTYRLRLTSQNKLILTK